MANKLKFIMCGCGGIANAWCRVFNELKDEIELVAACDPIPSAFNKLKQYGLDNVPTFSDLSLAFSEGIEADAVLVLTPPQYHVRYCREAIMNDCHVLTEKPFFCNMNDVRAIKDILKMIDENNKVAVVNQQYRWMPRMQDIKKALNEGVIGDIGFVVSQFCQNRYHFNAWWRQEYEDLSQINWFIHHYDTMRYLIGKKPEVVQAKLFRPPWSKIYGESTIFLNVSFEGGVEWHYSGIQEGVGAYEDSGQSTFTMYGSKGAIKNTKELPPQLFLEKGNPHQPVISDLGPMRPEDIISTDSSKGDAPGGAQYPPGWSTTMRYFIDAVRSDNEKKHPTDFRDNLWTIAIPLCARESWRRGGAPVNVKEYMGLE